jgi:pimeloyl-ACP methyl ester carboxylesterase
VCDYSLYEFPNRDSDKPAGTDCYDGRALAEEFRALVRETGFGPGRPLTLVAHDMGAPPALLWAADHPEEVAGLLYIEVPVILSEVLTKIIAYAPESMKNGSMWWWVLPLAPDIPERLIVGDERAFLTWFYERYATPDAIDAATVDEYLGTFSARGSARCAWRLPGGVHHDGTDSSHQTIERRLSDLPAAVHLDL